MSAEPLKLVVEQGPSKGLEIALDRPITVGRHPSCDLFLAGDEYVSSRHFEISTGPHGLALRNLSGNGTLVRGQRITESVRVAIGEEIRAGADHVLTIRPGWPVAAGPPPSITAPAETTVTRNLPPQLAPVRPAAPSPSQPASTPTAPLSATAPRTTRSTPAVSRPAPPREAGVAARRSGIGRYLPFILVAYLLMGGLVLLAVFGAPEEPSLPEVQKAETAWAQAHEVPQVALDRTLRLMELAVVNERRGDTHEAAELYREVLSARVPPDPDSPAYAWAAQRLAALSQQ